MTQEFQPGDRVRDDFNPERVCFVVPDEPYHLFTASFANGVGAALTLVARPVYPEPGQVAVLLDADELQALFIVTSNAVAGADSGYDIGDYFDACELLLKVYERAKADKRAREASRP